MPQLPPEFHKSRIAAYDSMLTRDIGNSFDSFEFLGRRTPETCQLLGALSLSDQRLALGILSIDDALFHLFSTLNSEDQLPFDNALSHAERATAYFEMTKDEPRAAEAISLQGLVYAIDGLSHPRGHNLVPKFTEAWKLLNKSRATLQKAGVQETLPTTAIVLDFQAKLSGGRGNKLTQTYVANQITRLMTGYRDDIEKVEALNSPTSNDGLAV